MTEPRGPADDRPEDGRYEIRLRGHLETRWAAWFDGMTLSHERDGSTVLSGPVIDQAALHGLLQKVRDIGLPLVSVTLRRAPRARLNVGRRGDALRRPRRVNS